MAQPGTGAGPLELGPGLEPGLEPGLGPGLELGPGPGLELELGPGLGPGLEPGLDPGLELEPGPETELEPGPEPRLELEPEPEPRLELEPGPEPGLERKLGLEPALVPELKPGLERELEPAVKSGPEPRLELEPALERELEPGLGSGPEPELEPALERKLGSGPVGELRAPLAEPEPDPELGTDAAAREEAALAGSGGGRPAELQAGEQQQAALGEARPASPDEPALANGAKPELTPLLNGAAAAAAAEKAATPRVFRRRWLVLGLYMAFAFCSSGQWIQYAIIANVVQAYYGVSSYAVDWTAIIFMATYIPFILPAAYCFTRLGLRRSVLAGMAGTAAGAWLKWAGAAPGRFPLAFAGQTLVGASQVFMLSLPPQLASSWFGPDQVSTACALGVFGNQLGVAVGFLLPPVLVPNLADPAAVGSCLSRMMLGTAGLCTALLLLSVPLFQERPPLPPSPEAAARALGPEPDFWRSLKRLARDADFLRLAATYAISLAVLNAFATLLNQLILPYFPQGGEEFAGLVGLLFIGTGMLGSLVSGIILDRTHRFKELTLVLYCMSTVTLLAFTFLLATRSKAVVALAAAGFGLFTGGYMTVAFELGSELTYPEPENTAAGLLLFASQVLSVPVAAGYAALVNTAGDVWANLVLTASLAVGSGITACIRPRLRRVAARAAASAAASQPC